MGHGLLHQSNTSGRISAVLARSKGSHGLGEKVGVGAITLRGDARRNQANLLYLEIRRGTQVAQGRGLQNLHSWVRIPPAPPSPSFMRFPRTSKSASARKGESCRPPPFVGSIFLAEFSSFRLVIAASPRQAPCKVAPGSGTRCRGPAPGSVGR